MSILLINPPHKAIGSRLAHEHLPPLGLLSIAGSLIDKGYLVSLLDADFDNLQYDEIIKITLNYQPDLVLLGHSGSTSAQPIINEITKLLKIELSNIKIIIGGVFPTYHWHTVLTDNPQIDFIVCGEGEQIILDLVDAIEQKFDLKTVNGIAFRENNYVIKTQPAKLIDNLDNYRVAWELMEGYHYTYWGYRKAVVIQFSRGCPYPCSYCGQSLFWQKWRHRNPQLLADEIEMLHKNYGVEVFNFADENPASNRKAWKEFLLALIAKNLDITLVGSIRADNIVRDAEYLHLYKQAGFERFLLGIESYNETVLDKIKKNTSISDDKTAIQLLRQHDILSMATYVVGFGEETTRDFFNSLKQLLAYDPDQIQLVYVTPHQWTPYFEEIKEKNIIQLDQRFWDYKHQIMEIPQLKPWQVLLYVKLIEGIMQTRPKAIYRWLFHRDKKLRKAMFWYNNIGKRVWFYEIYQFFAEIKLMQQSVTLSSIWLYKR
jgi:anaerobic magnesium-protoporphyrin IX monomethyl ester cyclase